MRSTALFMISQPALADERHYRAARTKSLRARRAESRRRAGR